MLTRTTTWILQQFTAISSRLQFFVGTLQVWFSRKFKQTTTTTTFKGKYLSQANLPFLGVISSIVYVTHCNPISQFSDCFLCTIVVCTFCVLSFHQIARGKARSRQQLSTVLLHFCYYWLRKHIHNFTSHHSTTLKNLRKKHKNYNQLKECALSPFRVLLEPFQRNSMKFWLKFKAIFGETFLCVQLGSNHPRFDIVNPCATLLI